MLGQMMDYPLTITSLLKRAHKLFPDREIVTRLPSVAMHRYTYGDCYRRVCQLANALKRLGMEPGERVGTFAWNNYQHLELYFAVPCSGAVIHTLNIRLSPDQLAYVINHAENKTIFVDYCLLPLLERAVDQIKTVRQYVLIGAPPDVETSLSPILHYEDLLAGETDDFRWPELDERSAAGLCYTSGTTGNPKGALYSHRSQFLHSVVAALGDGIGICNRDSVLAVVPMFHANAWGLPYTCAMLGTRLVLPGPHLKPADLAELIQDEKVTVAAGVPTLWIGLHQHLKAHRYDISSLRVLLIGGAAAPLGLIQGFEEDFNVPVMHAWGMTELSPMGTNSGLLNDQPTLTREERYQRKLRQGSPVPGIELRIVGEDGKELPWDDKAVGDLQVRGPWVVSSYFRDPSGDAQFTEDGWFVTGDVARINPQGSMQLTDRSKDLIKSGGEWISSVALENALMSHPKVFEAAVIAIPNEKWTERPLAVVVPQPGQIPTHDELIHHLADQFAKFWLPEEIRLVPEIPKTSVGKFDKKVLRQRYADGNL